ncbi:MAG TPA: AGE family epimerase/isomerase [Acidobacteriaceae bacterium]|nr:AGE family epimerase/isomerase [Acidobacteriaceae bacterium]
MNFNQKVFALDHRKLYNQYRHLLLDTFVPFWLKNGIDWKYGGVLSCLNDDGTVTLGDKFIWSQARSVWTFSALYNRIEKRPELLAAAKNSVRFLLAHGRNREGRWIYHTDQQGHEIEGATSIYTDCFVTYGFSEYYRATRDESILSVAREAFEYARHRIDAPGFQETAPYPLPIGWKNHGCPMIMTEVANELAQTTGDASLEPLIDDYVSRIMDHFVRPDRKVLLEFLTTDYREVPPPAGTFVMPGHAIESMWFVLHVARRRGDRDLIRRASEVIRWHLELGWDAEYGGIYLSRDIEGNEPYLPHSDKKIWWPHVEALYATLLAHELTGEPWCLEWYDRVAEWTWSHFPAPDGADWYQRLTREGKPTTEVIALPVKDPFHLPRGAMLIMQLMQSSLESHSAQTIGQR